MKRIFWITPESFLDVDLPIIKLLNKQFNFYWMVIGFNNSSRKMYKKEDIENFATVNGIKYSIISQGKRFRNPLIILFYLQIIAKIKDFKSDIVYTSYLGEPFFLVLLQYFFNKRKVVIAVHDVELHSSESNRNIKMVYNNYCRLLYYNFHIFSASQKLLFSEKYKNKNILTTPLCVKDFGKPSLILKSNKVRFLFFGSIFPYKGLDILILATNYLVEQHCQTDFMVTIAGNCNPSEWYDHKKLIKFPNFIEADIRVIENNEIANLFCNADYIVLPYRDVTQCGPLLIAYNYSLPAIVSDLDGFRDYVVDNITGFIFKGNDYKSLAEVMLKCIKRENNIIDNVSFSKELKRFLPDQIVSDYANYLINI